MVRRKIYLALTILFLFTFIASCNKSSDWIMFRGEEGRGAASTALHPPLGIKWKLRLQLQDNPTPAFNPPIVKEGTIYFGSADGNFYALDIKSGYMRWVFNTEGVINSIPFADGENVYFGSNDGKVYAVSLNEGRLVWSFQTESTVQSIVVRYHDTVVFTSDGGSTYFLSPEGELQHRLPNPVWHYDAFQIYENVMYFAPGPMNRPRSLGAFDLDQKSYLWILNTAALRATWYSFPALKGDYLFFATCRDRGISWELNYYAYDRETGGVIWKYGENSYFGDRTSTSPETLFRKNLKLLDYMAPSLWKNLVVFTSGDSVVRAFHYRRGTPAWRRVFEYPTSSAPTVAGDRVYFGLRGDDNYPEGQQPRVVCLSVRNGRKLWEMEIEGALLSAPVISGKWIIFGTDKNMFYVLEELY
jgi:outer membrane protein assembly factor BamB